nr:MAG TPA: hypothetical protein [Caudoviricetes sp.]
MKYNKKNKIFIYLKLDKISYIRFKAIYRLSDAL